MKLADMTVAQFVAATASEEPAPGGGYRLEGNTYQAVSPEKGADNERINH